jgi:hypothetical protein
MSRHQQYGKQLPETTSAQREVLIERTTLVEENAFVSSEASSLDAAGAMVTQYDPTGHPVGTAKPRPQATQHRPQGDLSNAQFQLLQNLERLTYSLQGPEESLDDTYSRPFPQIINRT